MRGLLHPIGIWCAPFAAVLAACTSGTVVNGGFAADSGAPPPVTLPDGKVVAAGGVGAPCSDAVGCRAGLACTNGACAFAHSSAEGDPCVAADECKDGLQCMKGICAQGGSGAEGDGCTTDADCQSGLRCGFFGLGLSCIKEGTEDTGQPCNTSADCYAGLFCAPGSGDGGGATCAPTRNQPLTFGLPIAPKLVCDPVATGAVTAYFDVPGADGSDPNADFFRLPFPTDIRIKSGKIDLSGFPTPGTALLGFDPVRIYLDAITENEHAWGAYPTTIFRFSGPINFDTFRATPGVSPVVYLDITDPKNPGNGGAAWYYSGQGGKYVCHDWFAVRRPLGGPLVPGHTYTVYLTTDGRDKNGLPIKRAPEFVALLAATAPADPALSNAYAAFEPLRAYLSAQSIPTSTVLTATVFTVAETLSPMNKLAAAVRAAPVPVASAWVKCATGVTSPCPQADGTRACGNGTADYDEYHALVSMPIFQKGNAPYFTSGGDIDSSRVVRTEDVCMALTVPKKAAPAAGFPVAVFAHGTGGSFRDHVRDEVAGALARATPPIAVLGYDQVEHGPRRGSSTQSPNVLFFNFANPSAARGNPLQGAADVISVGRFVKTFGVAVSSAPPGLDGGGAADGGPAADASGPPPPSGNGGPRGIEFDTRSVVFFGHSQGSMHGSLGLPFTNDFSAALLSGNGASLMDALLTKTNPVNIAAAVPFALGGDYDDPRTHKLFGGNEHPVLSILQQWIDPADPLNFAHSIARTPVSGILPKSVFQTYGLDDTYAPPVTLETYAVAADLPLAAHDPSVSKPDPIAGGAIEEQPVPISGNAAIDSTTVTLAVREYQPPSGKDGHFVVFDVPSANQDAVRFLSMAAAGKVPAVGK